MLAQRRSRVMQGIVYVPLASIPFEGHSSLQVLEKVSSVNAACTYSHAPSCAVVPVDGATGRVRRRRHPARCVRRRLPCVPSTEEWLSSCIVQAKSVCASSTSATLSGASPERRPPRCVHCILSA